MIKILCVGKLKEKYLLDMVNDYKNRINKYHHLEIIELKDSTKELEAIEIKKYIHNNYIISLNIEGKSLDTIEFKEKIEILFNEGNSNIIFIIGGSDGLTKEILDLSNDIISFSKLTFPHGLFRSILLEQIYRIFKIMNNESYHK